jgi:hypothetical protein
MDGNPIRNLPVSFRVPTGSGTGPGAFTTNADGYVFSDSEDEPGVELSGSVAIEIRPPHDHDAGIQADRLRITEDQEVTIPVRNPEEYGGIVVDSDSEGTDSTSEDTNQSDTTPVMTEEESDGPDADTEGGSENQRGFLTNDSDSPLSFLNDPVTLTWAGIAVSMVGIIVQLFGRQS